MWLRYTGCDYEIGVTFYAKPCQHVFSLIYILLSTLSTISSGERKNDKPMKFPANHGATAGVQ